MNWTVRREGSIEKQVGAKFPIKRWTVGVPVEHGAEAQLFDVANLPFIDPHGIAVMPDCLDINTEVLTEDGFVKITNLSGDELVANFDPETKQVNFKKVKAIIRRPLREEEKVFEYNIDTLNKSIVVSENHRMPVIGNEGVPAHSVNNMVVGNFHWGGSGTPIVYRKWSPQDPEAPSFTEILLLLWFWGDGSIKTTDNTTSVNKRIRFGFKKERKIKRVIQLLEELNYVYYISTSPKQTEIYINTESSKKLLKMSPNKNVVWELINRLTATEAIQIIDEAVSIDGDFTNHIKHGSRRINSTSKDFIDFISAIASIYFGVANANKRQINGYKNIDIYYVSLIPNERLEYSKTGLHNRKITRKEINYNDDVVCITCDTGFFIARQNGLTFVSGNCHAGKGATIGSVIPTRGAVIPAACGVDIGCGVDLEMTTLKSSMLPKDLKEVRECIEEAVPHGFYPKGPDKGSWQKTPVEVEIAWEELEPGYKKIIQKHSKCTHKNPVSQLGTLGSGNHFCEVVVDENNGVGIFLHSGSRGPGNRIGEYFIALARQEMKKWFIDFLGNEYLAFFPQNTELFDDYMYSVIWAQRYAQVNRELMRTLALKALKKSKLVPKFERDVQVISCHHNYVAWENHFKQNILITRKGAINAAKGKLGLIPANMGQGSYIVRGLGNKDSYCSASHGAGRAMSRTKAKETFTLKDHREAVKGVECRVDKDIIDETPGAYKNIDDVMNAQQDLVEIVGTLRQLICVKGS